MTATAPDTATKLATNASSSTADESQRDTTNPANNRAGTGYENNDRQQLSSQLEMLKSAFNTDTTPTASTRLNRLSRLHHALKTHQNELLAALKKDYGSRSDADTLVAEIYALASCIHYHQKHVRRWMKPEKRKVPMHLQPGRAEVHYQPVGVVGIVVPWNFPVYLAYAPLVTALTAGNLAMIKTSEFAPETSRVMATMIASVFNEHEVLVIEGDVDTAVAFTQLPFDHLVFTGATSVATHVMSAAAKHLTPVTLELGGKSPAIIHPDYSVTDAAEHIVFGKAINAGQVCVSPDYVLVHESQEQALHDAMASAFKRRYPTLTDNEDYTAIINARHAQRLQGLVEDAEALGAKVTALWPDNEKHHESAHSGHSLRKRPLTLIRQTNNDMRVMNEEIFGPLLPIVTYKTLDEAIAYVNHRERPLALYYFDHKRQRGDDIIRRTLSGGVCINECMTHISVDDMPFGGVGPSGMGHYHGVEGFRRFSHTRSVLRRGRFNMTQMIGAPRDTLNWRLFKRFQAWRLGL